LNEIKWSLSSVGMPFFSPPDVFGHNIFRIWNNAMYLTKTHAFLRNVATKAIWADLMARRKDKNDKTFDIQASFEEIYKDLQLKSEFTSDNADGAYSLMMSTCTTFQDANHNVHSTYVKDIREGETAADPQVAHIDALFKIKRSHHRQWPMFSSIQRAMENICSFVA